MKGSDWCERRRAARRLGAKIKYSSQELLDPRMLFGGVETVMAVKEQVNQRAMFKSIRLVII